MSLREAGGIAWRHVLASLDPNTNGRQDISRSMSCLQPVSYGPVEEAAVRTPTMTPSTPAAAGPARADSVVRHCNALLAERGLPSLS